ncbi:MAG: phosphatase PAP2 family protein [Nocardioides sp.]|uniref:phosphatase PAP2 family protein n=1 Tax=Nocardioides sp. TaxID=35761 RepID=UPI0039E6F6F7
MRTRTAARVAGEVGLAALLYLVYRAGRLLATGHEAIAREHARRLHELEQSLGLPSEADLQRLLPSPDLFHAANVYYVSAHFPITIAFLVAGLLFRPHVEYAWARNLLVVQTALALVLHIALPLAPPRMFPSLGFTDTMTVYGPSAYEGATATLANQYAAMPSLHVGWAVLIAVVVTRTGPRWLAVLAGAHAGLTVFVVVITANHWWLDGAIGAALLLMALLLFPEPGRHQLAVPRPARAPARAEPIADGRS